MSIEQKGTVQCPKCGKDSNVIFWNSLNGDLNPKAKQELLDGTLFRFVCPYCGYKADMDYAMLYHDMTHSVLVYYVAEESVEEIKTMMDAQQKINIPGYRRRIVTNQNALREKAIIFENEMDDRVIELIKYIYLTKTVQQYPDANIEAVYFLIADGKNILEFIGDVPISAQFDSTLYDAIAAQFANVLTEETDKEEIIDTDWARRIFQAD